MKAIISIKNAILSFVLVLSISVKGQVNNSKYNDTNINLREAFRKPPAEYRLIKMMTGKALRDVNLSNHLNEIRAGGVVINGALPKKKKSVSKFIDASYLNNTEIFELLRSQLPKLTKEGKSVWFYDELGFPSGSAGGRVLDGHPEFAAQGVRCRTILAKKGDQIHLKNEGRRLISCEAFLTDKGELNLKSKVSLTQFVKQGDFIWSVPKGKWTICVLENYVVDNWERNKSHRKRQNINIIDSLAVDRFMDLTHRKVAEEIGEHIKDIFLFFTDEPHLSVQEPWQKNALLNTIPSVQWCQELPTTFENKFGYSLLEVLPALFHNVGPKTHKYRFDFYDVYSDLIAKNYFAQIQNWCHNNGTYSSGHMLLEESLLFHPMFSGSMTKNWTHQDLPGIDQIGLSRYKTMGKWNQSVGFKLDEDFSIKMAASISTLNGKIGVFSESFAGCNLAGIENYSRAAKGMIAWQYASGVTHMGSITIQNLISEAEYADLAEYTGRIALLMRRGQPITDIAVLVPEASVWAFYTPPPGGRYKTYFDANSEVKDIDLHFRGICNKLSSSQRDFEIFTEELLNKANIDKGVLRLGGQSFHFLLLPEARMLKSKSLTKIEAFVENGGKVIFTGTLPYLSSDTIKNKQVKDRIEILLNQYSNQILFLKDINSFKQIPKWMNVRKEPSISWEGSNAIRIALQKEEGDRTILLSNPSSKIAKGKLTCQFKGKVSLWNPETGHIKELGTRQKGEVIDLTIRDDSAIFVRYE